MVPEGEGLFEMFNYIVKVRNKTFIWGSSGVMVGSRWPLILVINNDPVGDVVELGSLTTATSPTVYGTLQPGECWTIPLEGLRGVYAVCDTDTTMACSILTPQLRPV